MSEMTIQYPFLQDMDHYVEVAESIAVAIKNVVSSAANGAEVSACFYCDGGAKAHVRMAGWGLHGYFFVEGEPKQGSGCADAITANGYAKKDGAKAVIPVGYIDACAAIPGGTNNAAEAEAVAFGLVAALISGVKKVSFFCDSKYVLTGCTDRLEKMRQTNFIDTQTMQPIPNADRWKVISRLLEACTTLGVETSWNWVKGHTDYLGNIKADALASRGILQGLNNHFAEDILILPAKGYWNPTANYDRFLNEGRWFFQLRNIPEAHIEGQPFTYYLGNSAMDDMDHGVPSGEANFAVVKMPTEDPILKAVETHTRSLRSVHMDEIVVGRLDVLFNPSVYTSVENSGVAFLHQKNPRRLDLWASDRLAMTQEISPPRKSHLAVTAFRFLEETLADCEEIINGKTVNGTKVHLTEITNSIYEAVVSGKKSILKISPNVDKGGGSVVVPAWNPIAGQEMDLTLTIGIDTPKRNMLAAIASDEPRVWVVTWKESDRAFRYATLVKAGERIGIWAAVYSNIRLIA